MAALQHWSDLSSESTDEDSIDTIECLRSSSMLLDSDLYRRLVARRILEGSDEDTEADDTVDFCECRVCLERADTSINRRTKYYVEFQLHCLNPEDQQLSNDLVKRCKAANVAGYVIYTYDREHASGVMEGRIKNINKVKDWLETLTGRIPAPHEKNIYFSWFLVARQPCYEPFTERVKEPIGSQNSEIGLSE